MGETHIDLSHWVLRADRLSSCVQAVARTDHPSDVPGENGSRRQKPREPASAEGSNSPRPEVYASFSRPEANLWSRLEINVWYGSPSSSALLNGFEILA